MANYTDPAIYFAWAAVLEASHGPTDSDNFTLMLTDDIRHKCCTQLRMTPMTMARFSIPMATGSIPIWQVPDLDVNAMLRDAFTLTLLGADCPYGGHADYVYLNGFGGTNSTADHAGARHAGNGWNGRYRRSQLAASSPDVSAV